MTQKNNIVVGPMRVELLLPSEKVRENIVLIPKLPHGSNVVSIQTGGESLVDCDALITQNRALSLGIKTADCAPVCLSDGHTIGIVHIGWRGLCLGLIEKTLPTFNLTTVLVYIAPFLHSFEIKKDFCYEQITSKFGERYLEEKSGQLIFHFKDAIDSLLPSQTIYDSRDTGTDFAFPSYRRDATKDRFVTIVHFL